MHYLEGGIERPKFNSRVIYFCGAVKTWLAAKIIRRFQGPPVVVSVTFSSLPVGDTIVCTLANVIFNFVFGSILAFSLIRLTCSFATSILAFAEHLVG